MKVAVQELPDSSTSGGFVICQGVGWIFAELRSTICRIRRITLRLGTVVTQKEESAEFRKRRGGILTPVIRHQEEKIPARDSDRRMGPEVAEDFGIFVSFCGRRLHLQLEAELALYRCLDEDDDLADVEQGLVAQVGPAHLSFEASVSFVTNNTAADRCFYKNGYCSAPYHFPKAQKIPLSSGISHPKHPRATGRCRELCVQPSLGRTVDLRESERTGKGSVMVAWSTRFNEMPIL